MRYLKSLPWLKGLESLQRVASVSRHVITQGEGFIITNITRHATHASGNCQKTVSKKRKKRKEFLFLQLQGPPWHKVIVSTISCWPHLWFVVRAQAKPNRHLGRPSWQEAVFIPFYSWIRSTQTLVSAPRIYPYLLCHSTRWLLFFQDNPINKASQLASHSSSSSSQGGVH